MDISEINNNKLKRHPWEIVRRNQLLKIIKKHHINNLSYADVGCGDLYVTKKLAKITKSEIYAVDKSLNIDQKQTIHDKITLLTNINQIANNGIDRIILLDVLEHIEDDKEFVNQLYKLLKNNGLLIITVPAFNFLFSEHDQILKHHRRYSSRNLLSLFDNNYNIINKFYFFSSLFFIRFLQLILYKIGFKKIFKHTISQWKFSENNFITKLITIL
ncbi:class I SAM-dependent methyltransferase [bacterium]